MQVLFHMMITKNIFTLHAMRASAPKPLRGLLISCPPVNLAGEVLVLKCYCFLFSGALVRAKQGSLPQTTSLHHQSLGVRLCMKVATSEKFV